MITTTSAPRMSRPAAVVTGGSAGLGLSLGRELARRGFMPVLVARTAAALDTAVATLRAEGFEACAVSADVTDACSLDRAAETVRAQCGTIAWLVNNAGGVHVGTLAQTGRDAIEADLDVNLRGALLTTKAFLPLLDDGGTLLFISSGFGLMSPAGYAAYAASKAGIIALAEALRRELHSRRIAVYAAVPSDIDTPGFHHELASLPPWLARANARGTAQPADAVARTIVRKCRGRRFLVFSDSGVAFLYLATKLLPRRWRDALLDRMFPRPPRECV